MKQKLARISGLMLLSALALITLRCSPLNQLDLDDDYLTLTFSTRSPGGNLEYDPRNVHALWVMDAEGAYVTTLGVWGTIQSVQLTGWKAVVEGDVDAVTNATARDFGQYSVIWDLRDAKGQKVPDGVYRICHELTNHHASTNQYIRTNFTFVKDGRAIERTIPEINGSLEFVVKYTGR